MVGTIVSVKPSIAAIDPQNFTKSRRVTPRAASRSLNARSSYAMPYTSLWVPSFSLCGNSYPRASLRPSGYHGLASNSDEATLLSQCVVQTMLASELARERREEACASAQGCSD
jgi:hypothetical protein